VTSVTWPLFALPFALLALGLIIVIRRMRRPV
jgi:cytochrome c-type biogenesis protein CcmH/NrfF